MQAIQQFHENRCSYYLWVCIEGIDYQTRLNLFLRSSIAEIWNKTIKSRLFQSIKQLPFYHCPFKSEYRFWIVQLVHPKFLIQILEYIYHFLLKIRDLLLLFYSIWADTSSYKWSKMYYYFPIFHSESIHIKKLS